MARQRRAHAEKASQHSPTRRVRPCQTAVRPVEAKKQITHGEAAWRGVRGCHFRPCSQKACVHTYMLGLASASALPRIHSRSLTSLARACMRPYFHSTAGQARPGSPHHGLTTSAAITTASGSQILSLSIAVVQSSPVQFHLRPAFCVVPLSLHTSWPLGSAGLPLQTLPKSSKSVSPAWARTCAFLGLQRARTQTQ